MEKDILKGYQQLIDKNKDRFETYYNFLIEYNNKVNLTAITEKEQVYTKHFLDSILSLNEIDNNIKLIDIGTGAGFPGVPLKIVKDDINLTLVDSLNKRITFLNELSNKLNIKSINIHSRAEDFAIKNKDVYDVAVARAVAKTVTLVEYLIPLVKIGGKILLYKGSNYLQELEEATFAIDLLGAKVEKVLTFNLPNEEGERNIIVLKKVKQTPKIYPRDKNLPKLKPLLK